MRNLLRRPSPRAHGSRFAVVITLVFVVVGFVRGLEQSLAVSGDPDAVLVYSINTAENIENSAITAQVPGLLTASLKNVQRRFGQPHVSGELYMGTKVGIGGREGELGWCAESPPAALRWFVGKCESSPGIGRGQEKSSLAN